MTELQTSLGNPYEVWTSDFTDIRCEDCAVKFAKEHGLEWRGSKSLDSFTEDSEAKGASASCIPSWGLGDSDSPYSCCGQYLETNFTLEGVENLREDFPEWVFKLYFPHGE